jgi:hypothetical protein
LFHRETESFRYVSAIPEVYNKEIKQMDWIIVVNLITVLAWPVVVVVALLAFRKPLAAFMVGLGGRVTKLSAFNFSVELVALPASPTPWSDLGIPYNAELISGEIGSDSESTLIRLLTTPSIPADTKDLRDYLLVDIKDGRTWLISRVFLFAVFLHKMRGTKCVVFVKSKGEYHRRLIGLASPEKVRAALAKAYRWFETTLQAVGDEKDNKTGPLQPLQPRLAAQIIKEWLKNPEMRMNDTPDPADDWVELKKPNEPSKWEHTCWLDDKRVNKDLREAFYEWDSSTYVDNPDESGEKRIEALLKRQAPFIALVNSRGEFQRLLEREKIQAVAYSLSRD